MPASRTFSDLDLNFIANPITGDVSRKFDVQAIKQSVKTLILTNFYERPFHPEIGSQVNGLLFDLATPLLDATLRQSIQYTIENFEPRVQLISVDIGLIPDNNIIQISITFRIVNTTAPITVDLTLRRTR